ncbi:type II toxin-antitoxin system VapC family toxin [Dehalococcoidia bacterium]|nr:type II toxin-antitoxin system VapC family toxin [Dehalococcoidia bacterium]
MKTFFDSSSFAKRFVEEQGSQEVDDLCQETSMLGLSVICLPEIISALNRRLREKCLTRQDYVKAKHRLAEDIRDAQVINLIPAVIDKAIILLESNDLRSMDALHIACALEWQAETFVTSDKKQANAAKVAGLQTKYIE